MPTERTEDTTAESDDLTVIEGIGAQRERLLRKVLGVRTYEGLAGLLPAEVESRLRAEGQVVSRSAIEAWIVKAGELTARRKSAHEDWRPFAQFVVEFQRQEVVTGEGKPPAVRYRTQVHAIETDETERWEGVEGEQLSTWMVRRLNVEAEPEVREYAPVEPEAKPHAALSLPPVEMTEIRLFQLPKAERAHGLSVRGQAFSGTVKGDLPFASEVSFALSEEAALAEAERGGRYRIALYADDLATAATTHLGVTMPVSVRPDTVTYTAVLPETRLPAGVYRLRVLAERDDDGVVPEFLGAPLLRVV
jgi:hypothetical protein